MTTDPLGSPRAITDGNGAVTSRKDFAPFGEETVTSQRTTNLGYNPPNVRQDYTGYQKDGESGLDFAQARYYNSTHGRFTSVDPLTASASIRNPQTFNRYAYVLNSPYKFTDPLGLSASGICSAAYSSCDKPASGSSDISEAEAEYERGLQETQEPSEHGRGHSEASAQPGEQGGEHGQQSPQGSGMSPSEIWMARAFGGPGAYFSNPNDGDPMDQALGFARNPASSRRDPENHLYPSMIDPNATSSFYVPDGGKYSGEGSYTDGNGEKVRIILIYFAKLGGITDVTVAVFHLININTSMPRGKDGRRKLGDLGNGAGGSIGYGIRGVNGQGIHAHLEVYLGRHRSVPPRGKKPHTNFNGVVP